MNSKQTEIKEKEVEVNIDWTEMLEGQSEQVKTAYAEIEADFDKMITKEKEKMASAKEGNKGFHAEMIELLEVDKQEVLEGTIVGSPQYLKDEQFMHVFSLSAGAVMAAVGAVLLIKARKTFDAGKKKIIGWSLAGLGVGMIGLHLVEMYV